MNLDSLSLLWIQTLCRDHGNISWTFFYCVSLERSVQVATHLELAQAREEKKVGICYRGIGESHRICELEAVQEWAGALWETLAPLLFSTSVFTPAPLQLCYVQTAFLSSSIQSWNVVASSFCTSSGKKLISLFQPPDPSRRDPLDQSWGMCQIPVVISRVLGEHDCSHRNNEEEWQHPENRECWANRPLKGVHSTAIKKTLAVRNNAMELGFRKDNSGGAKNKWSECHSSDQRQLHPIVSSTNNWHTTEHMAGIPQIFYLLGTWLWHVYHIAASVEARGMEKRSIVPKKFKILLIIHEFTRFWGSSKVQLPNCFEMIRIPFSRAF